MSKYICFIANNTTFVGDNPNLAASPASIENTRQLREIQIPTPNGIATSIQVISCGVAREGVTMKVNLETTPHWYPEGDEEDVISNLIRGCEENEQKQRAKDSGLTLASSLPQ